MKRILIILSLLFLSESVLAGAAEDLSDTIYDKAMRERNGIGVSNVRVKDGVVTYDANQSVIQGGSKYKIEQKDIKLPASNDSIYKNAAKYAKGIFKGNLAIYASSAAMETLLKGVDFIMGPGGQIQKIPTVEDGNCFGACYAVYGLSNKYFKTPENACNAYAATRPNSYGVVTGTNCMAYYYSPNSSWSIQSIVPVQRPNPNPNEDPHKPESVSDPEVETAFYNWFKNNPSSVTDPVITYIYSPKDPKTGEVVPNATSDHPSFGGVEINDEMMNNYIDNYHDRLAREAKKEETIQKPEVQTETKPDSIKKELEPAPNGGWIETETKTTTNPETGEKETTITKTPISPDGIRGEPEIVKHQTETPPNPTVSELPFVCDYFAFLCDFVDWFKKDDVPEPEPDEVLQDIPDIPLAPSTIFSFSGQCPAPFTYELSDPFGNTNTIEFKYDTFCYWLERIKPWSIAIAHLIGMSMLFGRGQNG